MARTAWDNQTTEESSMSRASGSTRDLRQFRPATAGHAVDLREIFRVLWRQKAIILGTTIVLTLLAAVVLSLQRPIYVATSTVTLNAREQKVVDIESVLAGLPDDIESVQTEIQVLRSRDLAARVIAELGLGMKPEFNPALRPPAWYAGFDLRQIVPASWAALIDNIGRDDPADSEGGPAPDTLQTQLVNTFLGELDVSSIGASRALAIAFRSEDPITAAAIANALAEHYIKAQLDTKLQATARANTWLNDRLVSLRRQAETSQRAVEAYRRQSGLLMVDNAVTLPTQEVSELSSQLALAQAKRAEAEAQLQQAEAALNSSAGRAAVPEVLASGLIQSLRQQEATLMSTVAQLSAQYGNSHPNMITTRNQLAITRGKIATEVDRIVAALRNQVSAAQLWENDLRGRLDQLKSQVGELNEAQGELQILQGEAAANQALFDTFLARFKQTSAADSVAEADSHIISRAAAPLDPTFPKKKMLLMLSVVAAGFLGVLLAFGNELLDEGVRSSEQIDRLGFRPLGLVPGLGRRFRVQRGAADYVASHRNSAIAESIRGLHIGVLMVDGARGPKIVLVTSSVPGEGKTTIAIAWARLLAAAGKRALVIDCDLRRPSVHNVVGGPVKPGLADFLSGGLNVEDIVRQDRKSAVEVICAGAATSDPPALLASDRMKALLADLRQRYDLIILDSAPVLAVSDARVLCRLADRTVYLARWGKTRRKTVSNGLRQVTEAGGEIAGVLLTLVNVKRHAQYGFADSGYYYGQLAKYYAP